MVTGNPKEAIAGLGYTAEILQCGVERSSSKLWKTSNGCERPVEANIFVPSDETL